MDQIKQNSVLDSYTDDNIITFEGTIIVDNKEYNFGWIYYLKNGQEVKVYGIRHPSMYFEREYWHTIIDAAIKC